MNKITSLTLEGFRSFATNPLPDAHASLPGTGTLSSTLRFGDVTVLIGPNGAGKSTLVSFFDMLNFMTTGALQEYVGRQGGADSLLHYGARHTPMMRASLIFKDADEDKESAYTMALAHAANDTLIFTNEEVSYSRNNHINPLVNSLGAGHRESLLKSSADQGDQTSKVVHNMLFRCRAFHFHDTSDTAKIRLGGYIEDNRYLRSDAGNLAAFLYGLQQCPDTLPYYQRIENTVQLAFPQLKRFVLEPQQINQNYIRLNWYSRHHPQYMFGHHQLSDGALRFTALTTLLSQPPGSFHNLIVLDEPELGLHPYAIALLADMIKSAALSTQILVATQSPLLVDHFSLEQIRPIEHRHGRSVILDLDPEAYGQWLEEYSTGELWEKNIIGGGPSNG